MERRFDDYLAFNLLPIDFNNSCGAYVFSQKDVDKLLDDLHWYKMWHEKFLKQIAELKLELTDYRPTKLSGNGLCKCDVCGRTCWTDWFYKYKRKLVCNDCLKKMQSEERR